METPKIEGGDEAAAVSRNDGASSPPKLELKLRSLSELVANDIVDVDKLMETSTSIADSGGMAATEMGILDDGETFDDMVRRHTSTSWQTAGSAEPSQVRILACYKGLINLKKNLTYISSFVCKYYRFTID